MTRKRFRKLLRAYYTKLNMERVHMNMKLFNDMCRSAKIQHGVELNYNHSMYQYLYDVITGKIKL